MTGGSGRCWSARLILAGMPLGAPWAEGSLLVGQGQVLCSCLANAEYKCFLLVKVQEWLGGGERLGGKGQGKREREQPSKSSYRPAWLVSGSVSGDFGSD